MSALENVHAIVGRRKQRERNDNYRHHDNDNQDDSDDSDEIHVIKENPINYNTIENNYLETTDQGPHHLMTLPLNEENLGRNLMQDKLKRRLKYYFMSPIDKWKAKGRFPWKLLLQVIKILFVTIQLVIFGINMGQYLTLQGNMISSLRQIFLIGWDPLREVMAYPPEAGPFAVYKKYVKHKSF